MKKIYEEGAEARRLHKPRTDNPYKGLSLDFLKGDDSMAEKCDAWDRGWIIEDRWQKRGAPDFICTRK